MKKLLLTIALGVACVSALAQGQLNFSSFALPQVNVVINDAPQFGGATLGGTAFAADIFWGAAGTTDSTRLTALNLPSNFLTGAGAGHFIGGARTVPVAGGTTIVVQVRAWDTADGASYQQCFSSGSATARVGWSGLFNVTVTEPPNTPPNLVGLTAFSLQPVPEPSTMALAGLGAAALLIFRRRK